MLEEGYSLEEVARWANRERREIGEKYKYLTPPDLREEMFQRNREKYDGDKWGPDIDWFLKRGYSWEEIIDSAARPGGEDIIPQLIERLKE